jgi:pimeloyl-ACP methyl ester carboxylesterase
VLPAEHAYASLLDALGPDVEAVAKELEVYATPQPPEDYGLGLEVEGVQREADERGWSRFHLLGFSGGGAAALVCAATRAERLASLALIEPAWAGDWDLSRAEQRVRRELDRLAELPDEEYLPAFTRLSIRADVPLPPPPEGDPPPWLASRPAGIAAFNRAFARDRLDREALRRFDRPVYLALGALSNPDQYEEVVRRLAAVFPDVHLEVYEERHHFDAPHRVEPERLAASLRALWRRAEAR